MVSINDVAKKANVAKSTVSKVLNNYAMVSEETRKKVEDAVKELGYVPNSIAVSLSKKDFHRIGLIVDVGHKHQFVDEISMQYLTGAFEKSKEHHMDLVTFFNSQFEAMTKDQIVAYLKAQRIDSLIVFSLSSSDDALEKVIKSEEFYCVVIDQPIINAKTSWVAIDHYKAQYEVAEKTLAENPRHELVLYLAGDKESYIARQRLEAMQTLQQEMGFKLMVQYADFSEKKARAYTYQYARNAKVIVCASDMMAIGTVFALTEMDIFRPVCGFDGITLMGYTKVAMNTVKQDFYTISMQAFTELMRLLEGKESRYKEMQYKIKKINYLDILN
ncbi:MAG: LacI family DNA-binding transcriptional regulator [Cellulosilyticaceae bacterium]